MATKRAKYTMMPTPDPFIQQGFGQEKITLNHKNITEENNYIKLRESLTIDLSGTGVLGQLSFTELFNNPPENAVVNFSNLLPVARQAIDANNSDFSSLAYSVSSSYNYYSSQYEDIIEDISEFQIINIYNSTENGNPSELALTRHFSNEPVNEKTFMKVQQSNVQYIPSDQSALKRFLIFPENYDFSKINSEKNSYPFGIDITSGVDNTNNKLFNLLKKSGFYQSFVKSYLNQEKQTIPVVTEIFQSAGSETFQGPTVHSIDMINPPSSYWASTVFSNEQYYFGDLSETNQTVMLKGMLVNSFLKKLALDEMLSFEEVLLGKKNYTEVLFYKIEKSIGDNSNSPIQTFIVPPNQKTIKYFDTQIKPNKTYTYSITACTLVVGSEYTYVNPPSYNNNDSTCGLSVESVPFIQLVDMPVFKQVTRCVSEPTTPPRAAFYTKNNSDNVVNIRLMTNKTEQRSELFKRVTDYDAFIEQVLFDKNRFQEIVHFENTKSKIIAYEVFKMNTPPSRIEEFANHKVGDIEDRVYYGGLTYSTRIVPNKKCYYMFRSINQHGLKSNPSTIYEVELIKGSSTSRIVVNNYKLPAVRPPASNRNMRRLIQLVPASQHTFRDEYGLSDDGFGDPSNDGPTALDKVTLGIARKPIWGKRFKIRVTSNNTGRKIDFNVVFDLIKKKTN
tara:strand:- start:1768 stop:3792 length:2025 start_codon:yes stop_codon:yes gene_type:complete